jgi:predicted ATP-dependent Lon-type protease
MQALSLKEYMDSKRQLLKATENVPITIIEYEIKKYCTLSVGESNDSSTTIPLKPKQKVLVEWIYTNPSAPTPNKITIVDKETQEPIDEQDIYWTEVKMNKWLTRHAKAGKNSGHNIKK